MSNGLPNEPNTPPPPPEVPQAPPPAESAAPPEPQAPETPPRAEPGPRPRPPLRKERPPFRRGKPPALDEEEIPTSQVKLRDLDALIEQEMEAALSGMSDADLYAEKPERRGAPPEPGGPTKGRVVSVRGGDVFIDVPGRRSQGVMSLQQFDAPPAPGDEVEFTFEGYDKANGLLLLSRKGAAAVAVDWSTVSLGMTVEARVTATNKGGLAVEVNGIRGFMPVSQIDLYRVEDLEPFVNQRLLCQVVELDPEEKNLVVSRRALLEKEREQERERFWAEVQEGETRTGTVRSVKPFGVFVDLGGADGLVPASEMSWARVADPGQLVQVGQKVQVKVARVDREARRLTLSLRALEASPWDTAAERYPVGLNVTGRVTRVADFGAFVELEPGVEGLVHISELSPQRVRRVRDVVQEDQSVTVQVLNVDTAQRRMSLSLRAAQAAAQKAADAAAAESQKEAEGPGAEQPEPPKTRPRRTDLRGGIGDRSGGGLLGG